MRQFRARLLGSVGLVAILPACSARDALEVDGSDGSGGAPTTTGPSTSQSTGLGGEAGVGGAGIGGAGAGGARPDPTSIIEACVIAASCAADTGWPTFSASACVDGFSTLGWFFASPGWMSDPLLASRLLDCATTTDCAAFHACFGGDWIGLTRCREGAWCSDDLMTQGPTGPSLDCSAIGATCMDLWSGAQRACCNATPCSTQTDPECVGTTVSYCGGWGERIDFDCGPSGRTCGPDPYAPCQGTGSVCAIETVTTCSDATATYCSSGFLATQDCAANGLRSACAAGASSYEIPCRPSGSDCDPTTDLGACSGDSIRVCVDGSESWVSCPGLGFTSCVSDASGRTRCS